MYTLLQINLKCVLLNKRNRVKRLIPRIQLIRDSGRGRSVGTEHKAARAKVFE